MTFRHTFFKTQILKRRADELNAWGEIDELKKILDVQPDAGDVNPGGDGLRFVSLCREEVNVVAGELFITFLPLINDYSHIRVAKNEISDLSHDYLDELVSIRNAAIQQHTEKLHEKDLLKELRDEAKAMQEGRSVIEELTEREGKETESAFVNVRDFKEHVRADLQACEEKEEGYRRNH